MQYVATFRAIGVACTFTCLMAATALAGPYSDDLAKCLVKSTSNVDRNALVKWMFAAAASHPEVRSIAAVSEAQLDALNQHTAKLFERLLTESCRTEAQQALRYEGQSTIEMSFGVLGQVAGRELFSDPQVTQSMAGIEHYIDKQKMEKLIDSAR